MRFNVTRDFLPYSADCRLSFCLKRSFLNVISKVLSIKIYVSTLQDFLTSQQKINYSNTCDVISWISTRIVASQFLFRMENFDRITDPPYDSTVYSLATLCSKLLQRVCAHKRASCWSVAPLDAKHFCLKHPTGKVGQTEGISTIIYYFTK